MDRSFKNEMYWDTTSSSMKSNGVVIKSLMWLLDKIKTSREYQGIEIYIEMYDF